MYVCTYEQKQYMYVQQKSKKKTTCVIITQIREIRVQIRVV
jgi:hypothetical protein